MLILDKTIGDNQIYVVASKYKTYYITTLVMRIHSTYINKSYTLNLGTNYSLNPDRGDIFVIPASSFYGFDESTYSYAIDEVDENGISIGTVKVGLLRIIDGDPLPYRSLEETDQSSDEFKVYQGI